MEQIADPIKHSASYSTMSLMLETENSIIQGLGLTAECACAAYSTQPRCDLSLRNEVRQSGLSHPTPTRRTTSPLQLSQCSKRKNQEANQNQESNRLPRHHIVAFTFRLPSSSTDNQNDYDDRVRGGDADMSDRYDRALRSIILFVFCLSILESRFHCRPSCASFSSPF